MQSLPISQDLALCFTWCIRRSEESLLAHDLVALLREAKDTGTLAAAAKRAGMSYRKAWTLVTSAEADLGQAIVRKARGKGITLSPLGQAIVDLDDRLREAIALTLENQPAELATLGRLLVQPQPKNLRFCLSHDVFLAGVVEALPAERQPDLEIKFNGSLDALKQFAQGDCDVAGFHLPTGARGQSVSTRMQPYLMQPDLLVQPLLKRVQGLMFRRDSALPMRELRDLLHPAIRFVNRQRNSGTRLLFDALLAEAGIATRQIKGYRREEFTHSAVAAEVASGTADVGFGTGAAARQYSLRFLPLADEVYSLVWRKFWQSDERLQAFLAFLSEFIALRLAAAETCEGQLIQSNPLTVEAYLDRFINVGAGRQNDP